MASYTLASKPGDVFKNAQCNDMIIHTKFTDQKMILSPVNNGAEGVLTLSSSNVRFNCTGGLEIMTDSNFMFNALRMGNSNKGIYAGTRTIWTNDIGDARITLTNNRYAALHNSLSNSVNVMAIENTIGDIVMSPACGVPSVFMRSNTGWVGVNYATPLTWLHIQASNTSEHGHVVIERTNPGGFGGQLTLKNASHTSNFNNASTLAFQLHRYRDPYLLPDGREWAHASIGAWLDSNNADYTSLRFTSLGVEKMRIATDGKVGMGVSNPIAELHVRSLYDTSAVMYLGSNDTYGYSLRKLTDGSLNWFRGTLGNETFVMNMLTNGNIGMGVSNPVTNVHIQSQGTVTANIHLGSNDQWGYNMQKRADGSLHMFSGPWAEPPGAKRYSISMLNNANVGIMHSNPSTPLHINASESNHPTYNGVLLSQAVASCNAIIAIQTQQTGSPFVSMSTNPANPIGWSLGVDPSSTPFVNSLTLKNDWNWGNMALMTHDLSGSNIRYISTSSVWAPTLTLTSSNYNGVPSFVTLYGGDLPRGASLNYTTNSFLTVGHRTTPTSTVTERVRISMTGKMGIGSSNTFGVLDMAQDINSLTNHVVIEAGNTTDLLNEGFSAINWNGYTSNSVNTPYTGAVVNGGRVINAANRSRWRWFVDQRQYLGRPHDAMGMDVYWPNGTTSNIFTIIKQGYVGIGMTPFDTSNYIPKSTLHIYNNGVPSSVSGGFLDTGVIVSNSNIGHAINFGIADSTLDRSNAYAWIQGANTCNAAYKVQLGLNPVGGWVGIGTSNPVSTLQVRTFASNTGTIYMGLNENVGYSIEKEGNGSLHIQSGLIASPHRRLTLDAHGRMALHNSNPVMDVQFKNSNDASVEILLGSNVASTGYVIQKMNAGNLNIMRGNSVTKCNVMTLTNTGRVGLSEMAPVADLHINNHGVNRNQATIYLGSNTVTGYVIDKNSAGSLNILRGGVSASNLVMSMDSNGRIGMKTDVMTQQINVASNMFFGNTTDVSIGIDNRGQGARLGIGCRSANFPLIFSANSQPLVFGSRQGPDVYSGNVYGETMRIIYNSNNRAAPVQVAIGMTTPDADTALHVNGIIRATDRIYATNGITMTSVGTADYFNSMKIDIPQKTQPALIVNNIVQGVTFTTGSTWGAGIIPIGGIIMWCSTTLPAANDSWLWCDGDSYSTATYAQLYAVIGNNYGGNTTTFNVPDMRGRFPLGFGNSGTGDATADTTSVHHPLNDGGGLEKVQLQTTHLPAHRHAIPNSGAHGHQIDAVGGHTHGGTDSHTHTHDASSADNGEHNHKPSGSTGAVTDTHTGHTHGGTAKLAGDHAHTGKTSDGGAHDHTYSTFTTSGAGGDGDGSGGDPMIRANAGITYKTGGEPPHTHDIPSGGNHTHELEVTNGGSHTHSVIIPNDGKHKHNILVNNHTHSHTIPSDGGHNHKLYDGGNHNHGGFVNNTGGNSSHENMPPFRTVQFIIRCR
jgi:microcystin-dependent protein